jgi:hypothetical protein
MVAFRMEMVDELVTARWRERSPNRISLERPGGKAVVSPANESAIAKIAENQLAANRRPFQVTTVSGWTTTGAAFQRDQVARRIVQKALA